ncbi:unnamed protein product, partial [Meganyctiphanes norvegica]
MHCVTLKIESYSRSCYIFSGLHCVTLRIERYNKSCLTFSGVIMALKMHIAFCFLMVTSLLFQPGKSIQYEIMAASSPSLEPVEEQIEIGEDEIIAASSLNLEPMEEQIDI